MNVDESGWSVGAGVLWALACALLAFGCDDASEAAPEPAASEPGVAAEPEAAPEPEPAPAPSAPAPAVAEGAPATGAPLPDVTLAGVGFKTPESVLHDVETDVYLVSNINGSPTEADDNGFISRVKPDGTIESLKWIDGARAKVTLNAPKGMTIADGVLYVTDISVVRKFDARTGEPMGEIPVAGATFLNDLASGPDGAIYFSDTGVTATPAGFKDTGADAVYKLLGDAVETLAKTPELGRPNGLFVDESGVWVVTFGSGEIYRIEGGKKVNVQKLPKGSLDGIVKTNEGKLVISSWEGEQVVRGSPGSAFETLLAGVKAPADIGYDAKRNRLLVPKFMDDAVQLVAVDAAGP